MKREVRGCLLGLCLASAVVLSACGGSGPRYKLETSNTTSIAWLLDTKTGQVYFVQPTKMTYLGSAEEAEREALRAR